jgi:hypothetical protein
MLAVLALFLQGCRSETWLDILCFEDGDLCNQIESKAKANLKSEDYNFYKTSAGDQKSALKKCLSKILFIVFNAQLSLDLKHLTKGKRWVWVEHETPDSSVVFLSQGLTKNAMKEAMKERKARRSTLASAELILPSDGGDVSDRIKLLLIRAVVEVRGDWTMPAVVFGDDDWISGQKKVKCTNLVILDTDGCDEKRRAIPQDIFDSETVLVMHKHDDISTAFGVGCGRTVGNTVLFYNWVSGTPDGLAVDSKNRVRLGLDTSGEADPIPVDLRRGSSDKGIEIGVVDIYGELLKPFKDTKAFQKTLAVPKVQLTGINSGSSPVPILLVGPADRFDHTGVPEAEWSIQRQAEFWKIADDPGPGEEEKKGLSTGVIVAIVIVCLLVLIAIIVAVVCYMRRKKQKDKEKVDAADSNP